MHINWIKPKNSPEWARIRREAGLSDREDRQATPRPPLNGPITRPVVSLEREREIAQALAELKDAEDRYIEARAKFRALGGIKGDPGLDERQILFAFANKYVTEHFEITPLIPGRMGVNSDRLAAKIDANWTAIKKHRKT